MNKWLFFSIAILLTFSCIIYLFRTNSITTLSYFPIDNETTFEYAHTNLEFLPQKDNDPYKITWAIDSKSDKTLYLRQDVSLLYDNGRLRGVQSKWAEDTNLIQLNENIYGESNSLFQVISYHHGEKHDTNNQISSIQHMSNNNLYVIDSPKKVYNSFGIAENNNEKKWKKLLDRTTKQQLTFYWNQLISHFNINNESYFAVPLTSLGKYNNTSLPSLTMEQTNQIIGQLWEGLYKSYVIPAANSKNNTLPHYVPLILFDKNHTHLIVLFELNGEKKQLIQKLPN